MKSRTYFLYRRATRWMPSRFLAVPQAFWMGALDPDDLNEVTRRSYMDAAGAGFADEAFNLGGLWPWEDEAASEAFAGCRKVLVAGAGGGREAIALARMGLETTAFDFCEDLVYACRRNVARASTDVRVLHAPADSLPDGLGRFDGVFIGRGFYHHILGAHRRVALLRACRQILDVGAALLLSDVLARTKHGHRLTPAIANWVRRLRCSAHRADPGDWLSASDSAYHAFAPGEIESEFAQSGFAVHALRISPMPESHLVHAIGRAC